MAGNAPSTISRDTRTLIDEFLEVFLRESGYGWLARYENANMNPFVFILPEGHYVFSIYKDFLPYSEIVEPFRKALDTQLADWHTDTGIPFLKTFHLDYFIDRWPMSWTVIGCILLLTAVLVAEYMRSDNTIIIAPIVNRLSTYFARKYVLSINPLGGWKNFWNQFVIDVQYSSHTRLKFNDFADLCVDYIFNGRFTTSDQRPSRRR